ncbi:MAG: DUF3000 domain-containing protein [Bifidobacteriaceae bacterium]|nr:DUF3000 domain-containing protein [Bifidobacteriaceae bacterium]
MKTSALPDSRFAEALESIRAARTDQVVLEEIPAPARAATYAVALEARVPGGDGEDAAAGSIIVLHEPGGHVVWEGDFRIVTVAKALVEPELGADPFLAQVAWCWLAESLDTAGIGFSHLAGTITRTVSETFGDLKVRGDQVGIEARASWTPSSPDVGPHLAAWLGFLMRLGGIEPLPKGVVSLAARR